LEVGRTETVVGALALADDAAMAEVCVCGYGCLLSVTVADRSGSGSGRRVHDWHDGAPMRLFALRGATTVDANEPAAILDATEELMRAIMERNAIGPADVVSCIFTMTDDLDAEFPAVAARGLGFERVPLLCAREVPVPGALGRVIRVLIHYYADEAHRATHVYLGKARTLRADLESAQ
jgi:chorismate mutase